MKQKEKKVIDDALRKVALGCSVKEVVEEYGEVDGEMKLLKRRETQKDIPPDLKAVQLLLGKDEEEKTIESMTDEELDAEKQRLLGLLQTSLEKEKLPVGKNHEKTIKEKEKKLCKKKTN